MKNLTILTGASRGMGLAMAEQLCLPGAVLLCISRTASESLEQHAAQRGATLTQWTADLDDPIPVAERLHGWLTAQNPAELLGATLINNAGIIGRMGPLDPSDAKVLAMTLRVNLEAPMQLSAAFLAATRGWDMPRKILNISSGLGRSAMAGGAMYCATKAGMDHYSRCVALDEAGRANAVRIVSLAPGIIDTDMQTALRTTDAARFPGRERFIQAKDSGALTSPSDAAKRVLAHLARADFGSETVSDVRGV